MAQILDGKKLSAVMAEELSKKVSLLAQRGIQPKLVIIQVGDHPESNTYIKNKKLFGEKIGATVEHKKFAENATQKDILAGVTELNTDAAVHGIIVQLPLPAGFDTAAIIDSIDPAKDVDGMTAKNIKLLFEDARNSAGEAVGFTPATTKGIITLLDGCDISVVGKKVVIVGHSVLVGKPTALAMLNLGATVTVCHSQTKNLSEETRQADILIVAVGRPGLITKDFIKEGQVIIDIGITVVEEKLAGATTGEIAVKKIRGDVDFENVKGVVAAITPVPGGVGPMTIVSLFQNLLQASQS